MKYRPDGISSKMGYVANAAYQKKHVTITIQGKYLSLRWGDNVPHVPPKRQEYFIQTFSRASRLRLYTYIAQIEWSKIPMALFITLTYPDVKADRTYYERTVHRHRFLRDMEKHLRQRLTGLWRVEWKARKSGIYKGLVVPHVHLLVATNKYLCHRWLRDRWRLILDHVGPLATDVQRCVKGEIAAAYIAKYMAKIDVAPSLDSPAQLNTTGRAWGFIRKPLLPMAKRKHFYLPPRQSLDFLKAFGKEALPWYQGQDGEPLTLFGPKAIEAIEFLGTMGLTVDGVGD